MAGLSKIWFGTLSYNCYELGHTWSPNCLKAIHMFGSNAVRESLKLYLFFYLADFVIRRHKLSVNNVKQLVVNILQSTTFLGITGYVFLACVCIFRHSLGSFNIYTAAFLPGFVSSLMGILVERRNRRCALTLYVANVACETLFRMLKAKNIIRPLPYGEVFIFSTSMAVYMYQLRMFQSQDMISKLFKYLFVNRPSHLEDEQCSINCKHPTPSTRLRSLQLIVNNFWSFLTCRLKRLPKSPLCTHFHSCVYSTLSGFLRAFGIGYAFHAVVRLLPSLLKVFKNPSLIKGYLVNKHNLRLGLFFGSFVAVFQSVSCSLKWIRKSDDPIHTIPAGFLAGLTMIFFRNSTVALYVAWRVIEIFYRSGMNAGYLPRWDAGVLVLYAASTALLFHAAVIEPQYLKPSYYRFIDRMTGGLVRLVNRTLIDEIGVHSSTLYPNFQPQLDKCFMTHRGIAQMNFKATVFGMEYLDLKHLSRESRARMY